jgi:peptidoglycan/xylan/chitin deacetylase (PgdA/CDA1 family)
MDYRDSLARSAGNTSAAPVPERDSAVSLMLGKGLMRMLSPGGARGLSIFIYHRVLPHKDPLFPAEVDQADFDHDLHRIKSMFNVISLLDAVRHTAAGSLPPRAACITFDDGYADNAEVALPILQRHKLPATFFVATGFLNGGRMWNDTVIELVRRHPAGVIDASSIGLGSHQVDSTAQRQQAIQALIGQLKYLPLAHRLDQVSRLVDIGGIALPDNLMMSSSQVNELNNGGMDIGGHTVNHPILAKLPPTKARLEIAEGKLALENIIGEPVRLFAYPNGKPGTDYLAEHVAMTRDLGFEGAVSTAWGAGKHTNDVFQLPRFSPWDRTPLRFALRMAKNLTTEADFAI